MLRSTKQHRWSNGVEHSSLISRSCPALECCVSWCIVPHEVFRWIIILQGLTFRLHVVFGGVNVVHRLGLHSTPPSALTVLAFSTSTNDHNKS